jgi:hypothetical protein
MKLIEIPRPAFYMFDDRDIMKGVLVYSQEGVPLGIIARMHGVNGNPHTYFINPIVWINGAYPGFRHYETIEGLLLDLVNYPYFDKLYIISE